MKSAQMYPSDFDGVVAGAPAQWWPHLNGFTMHINMLNANRTTPGAAIPASLFTALNKEVVFQCDKLDGVLDGVITNAIYTNWTSTYGDFLFPTFEAGSESGWGFIMSGAPFGPASDYFSYQVLNKTSITSLQINETELQRLTAIADATDPGQTNAIDQNLKPFFNRGGKLLQYHGFATPSSQSNHGLVRSGSSLWYYERVRSYFKGADLGKNYRLFMAPGVGHCSGGAGADSFGGPGQRSESQGGAGQSIFFNAQNDMILATMEWVEKGVVPESIASAKYINGNRTQGTAFTRLLCPYPQV
ncbi:hypothetical protein FRC07_013317 [Ceratobasidium sp. 392]|nr:hypothetical protein FRC07_013317 [Ceratobasidium sp. 392]